MDVNLEQAQRYLQLLGGNSAFTFQTFDDSPQKRAHLARVFHGSLAQHAAALTNLNRQGAGVYVMVNEGDGKVHPDKRTCRTAKNVIRVRALFVDLDGAPLQPLLDAAVPPDIIVESSPGRYHGYWLGVDCPLVGFTPSQLALAKKFDGDPSVSDLPRVMRVPGFFHQKGEPFMTCIIKPLVEEPTDAS